MGVSCVLLMCSRGGTPPGFRASIVRFRRGRVGQEASRPDVSTGRTPPPMPYFVQSLYCVFVFIAILYAQSLIVAWYVQAHKHRRYQ